MSQGAFIPPDEIRSMFAEAMSAMYRAEVPQYGTLLELVSDVNLEYLTINPQVKAKLIATDELSRVGVERHGAIRLGTATELWHMRRLFAVMGMVPVGYYDLSQAGVPVHATSFRPVDQGSLRRNPFRVFTSLLRLELIEDVQLRNEAVEILAQRTIFTEGALRLIGRFERCGGLTSSEAAEFVSEALETFRWHGSATVSLETYERLLAAHRLVADVVSFPGPHINHLTPRTFDIDAVQLRMPSRGIKPKAVIEGPPGRACDILLRQTSFKALEEPVTFRSVDGEVKASHMARFGEIEQRGVALTRKGRELYDKLLEKARTDATATNCYDTRLQSVFSEFPDDYATLRSHGLAFFQYHALKKGAKTDAVGAATVEELVSEGYLACEPIVYEDFLPISAAGIFQSNLGTDEQQNYASNSNKSSFEGALGVAVADEFEVYASIERSSLQKALADLVTAPYAKSVDQF